MVREEIARPLGVDFEIGFGPALDARVAPLLAGPDRIRRRPASAGLRLLKAIRQNPEGVLAKTFGNPPLLARLVELARVARGGDPGRERPQQRALARAHLRRARERRRDRRRAAALARGDRPRAHRAGATAPTRCCRSTTRSALGFFLPTAEEPLGPNPRVFGHGGAGGSYSMADPEQRLSFGYVMNLMHTGLWLVDPRPRRLLAAAYGCL